MIAMTPQQIAQLDATPDGLKPAAMRSMERRGIDVRNSPFGVMLGARREKKPKESKKGKCGKLCRVSRIGDRVREKTAWTGIPACQRCRALAQEMNQMTAAEVRSNVEPLSAQMLANIVALSRGQAADLGWWDRMDARAKTWAALKTLGEDGVQARCKAVILEACDDEEREGPPACKSACDNIEDGEPAPDRPLEHSVDGVVQPLLVPIGSGPESLDPASGEVVPAGMTSEHDEDHGDDQNRLHER